MVNSYKVGTTGDAVGLAQVLQLKAVVGLQAYCVALATEDGFPEAPIPISAPTDGQTLFSVREKSVIGSTVTVIEVEATELHPEPSNV